MATVRQLSFTEEDLAPATNYDDLEGDYIATLTEVKDIEASTGNYGWGFVFDVKGLPLTSRIWLKGGGKWKIREVFNALGQPLSPGQSLDLDPNVLVGNQCVVTIGKEPRENAPGEFWTNITRHTPLVTQETASL